jgi:hypothetical protein
MNDAPLMTADEVIAYLRLNSDQRNPAERLRNLIRRQGLPVIRRGRLQLFRRSAIDEWLDVPPRARYSRSKPDGCPAHRPPSRKEVA